MEEMTTPKEDESAGSSSSDAAAQLKDAGNALFVQKKYTDAARKYTEALAIEESAVLLANRSACRLGLGKYADALTDARRATDVDPTYAKGYARVATAYEGLGMHLEAIGSWTKAIEMLSTATPSAAQTRQKELYENSLNENRRFFEAMLKDPTILLKGMSIPKGMNPGLMKDPGDVSEELLPEIKNNMFSSAWVVLGARKEYTLGTQISREQKPVKAAEAEHLKKEGALIGDLRELRFLAPDANSDGLYVYKDGAMRALATAMLRDKRVYNVYPKDFFGKFDIQETFEMDRTEAWGAGPAEDNMKEAKARLAEKGWDALRPALEVTVYHYIMHAGLDSSLKQRNDLAVQYCERAVNLIRLGREEWKDVPSQVRGHVFDDWFYNAIRAFHIGMYSLAGQIDRALFTVDNLEEFADELLNDIEKTEPPPPDDTDPGYALSFHVYPKAMALAQKGNCHNIRSVLSPEARKNPEIKKRICLEGSRYMIESANLYPPDEDIHLFDLYLALDMLYNAQAPLSEILPIMERIRTGYPLVKKYWPTSYCHMDRDGVVAEVAKAEKEAREGLAKGKLCMDGPFSPTTAALAAPALKKKVGKKKK
ncbi:hypothetical protein HGRIS_003402 [Hohenbuehelia grisea]|uniref:Uncharacterized protein n=1 Tax=Hohenbuehelia grisea TaxID=104357 RepID=A0ABR3JGU8_9AGAR